MSTPSLRITPLPESTGSATKILCFGCNVSSDLQGSASTLNDDNDDFDDPLKVRTLSKYQSQPVLPLDLENVGIVGTITLLGRSTAMVWVGWGRLQDKHRHDTSAVATKRKLGAVVPFSSNQAYNLMMGPLMVSLPRKSYQGAFASDIPSSKLINVSDLESDLMARQMSERISQQLQMAILVSCHFDDASAPKYAIGTGMNSDVENHMLRRRALTIAENEICQRIKQHQSQPSM